MICHRFVILAKNSVFNFEIINFNNSQSEIGLIFEGLEFMLDSDGKTIQTFRRRQKATPFEG